MNFIKNCFILLLFISAGCVYAQDPGLYEKNGWIKHKDVAKNADNKLLPRLPETIVQFYRISKFDKYSLPISPLIAVGGQKKWNKQIELEGKVSRTQYSTNISNNTRFLYNSYLQSLKKRGWSVVFSGYGDKELGNDSSEWCNYYYGEDGLNQKRFGSAFGTVGKNHAYIAAQFGKRPNACFVALYIAERHESPKGLAFSLITQDIIEPKCFKAPALGSDVKEVLKSNGFYRLSWAKICSLDSAYCNEKFKYLSDYINKNPKETFFIVGHVNVSGKPAQDLEQSKLHADQVAKILISRFHCSPAKLKTKGMGAFSPIAASETSVGREMNSRIDIIPMIVKTENVNHGHPKTKGNPSSVNTRARARSIGGVPDFDIKEQAILAAHGQADNVVNTSSDNEKPSQMIDEHIKEKYVAVPSVEGKWKISAKRILKKNGFEVKIVGKKIGRVKKQNPKGGTKAIFGSTVTITIGK